MRTLRLLGSTSFALLLLSGSARAQEDPISDTARELFHKGMKAYDQQKWDQCRAALLAAFAIKRHSQIAGNLAECEMHAGAYRDAAEHAWFFAHTLRADAPPERRAMAETALRETQQKVGTLTITVDVADADVLVDGKSVGKAPLSAPVFVEPGRHTIEALHAQDPGARSTVDVAAGGVREVVLTLKKKEPPPTLPLVEKRPLWPVLASGGFAVVALGVGVGLTVAANGKAAAAASLRAKVGAAGCAIPSPATAANCSAVAGDLQSQTSLANGAAGALASGGALAVATAGLAAWALMAPTAKVRVTPTIGANDAGVVVTGAW